MKVLKKIAILVLVLLVPGFLYYLLTAEGKNRYKPLPIYGPKVPAKTTHRVKGKDIPDTLYHTLSDFNLKDQDGNPVTLKSFDNKIFIANFFYSRCPTVCKLMNQNVSGLATTYGKNNLVYFVSISVDPEHDTAPVLKNYTGGFKPFPRKWIFLTGDTTTIYNLARNGFLVNALETSKDDFIYSDKFILIDAARRIRGYYSGGSTADVSRLNDEIKVLISEELRKKDAPLY